MIRVHKILLDSKELRDIRNLGLVAGIELARQTNDLNKYNNPFNSNNNWIPETPLLAPDPTEVKPASGGLVFRAGRSRGALAHNDSPSRPTSSQGPRNSTCGPRTADRISACAA